MTVPQTRKRKLTDDDVRAIRDDDRPLCFTAAQFGISETHACAVKLRQRKAGVPDEGDATQLTARWR